MKYITLFSLPLLLFGGTTFITDMEYAAQLYKNPRGIGCQHCHGENGEGRLIAKYTHKGVQKSFSGPSIDKLNFKSFYKELNRRKRGMPRYFLTSKEIQALYLYLHKNDKRELVDAK